METPTTTAPTCAWREDNDGCWHTACGHAWQFTAGGTPAENSVRYCHGCGRVVAGTNPATDGPDVHGVGVWVVCSAEGRVIASTLQPSPLVYFDRADAERVVQRGTEYWKEPPVLRAGALLVVHQDTDTAYALAVSDGDDAA